MCHTHRDLCNCISALCSCMLEAGMTCIFVYEGTDSLTSQLFLWSKNENDAGEKKIWIYKKCKVIVSIYIYWKLKLWIVSFCCIFIEKSPKSPHILVGIARHWLQWNIHMFGFIISREKCTNMYNDCTHVYNMFSSPYTTNHLWRAVCYWLKEDFPSNYYPSLTWNKNNKKTPDNLFEEHTQCWAEFNFV